MQYLILFLPLAGGLLISEGTFIAEEAGGYIGVPGALGRSCHVDRTDDCS